MIACLNLCKCLLKNCLHWSGTEPFFSKVHSVYNKIGRNNLHYLWESNREEKCNLFPFVFRSMACATIGQCGTPYSPVAILDVYLLFVSISIFFVDKIKNINSYKPTEIWVLGVGLFSEVSTKIQVSWVASTKENLQSYSSVNWCKFGFIGKVQDWKIHTCKPFNDIFKTDWDSDRHIPAILNVHHHMLS